MNAENPQGTAPQTISLADEEGVKDILVNTVFSLWDIVSNLTRLRPSKRDRYRVTVFGSARAQPGTFVYDEVKRLASALAEMGCDIITGGGPGLMQAANEGSAAAGATQRNRSIGIRVDLPFEQDVNPFVEQAFTHKTFFTRHDVEQTGGMGPHSPGEPLPAARQSRRHCHPALRKHRG